ncbi:MAG: thiol:disulfide interchange protein DsbA/DsbL [Chromatiaceae bacterium]|nr:thiol:disulfide interchange protein DsbA/DsbL [Gammaproteobacteria bacterium]MCP5427560.1 thiol:disulfide interchange protein DsbA/DsbL [Chromatiaceae bacterium]MCB1861295.1 thiol:disulfide interchange protein DsbA/DsbL [Gammaproteobacteria bacterium]MCB1871816.1 thiol:disulfide interchange protein DsbA/DsbL [Gammaproteobacteria bacterium]MCB1878627.1 thiol:disulfide interchange protein DsbA/DsbL [Gammaproteobacteria bacterium]
MKKHLILSLLALVALILTGTVSSEPKFEEDLHYFAIFPAQPGGEGERIQVTEFFLYTCPHCYQLEPHIDAWLKNKPNNVDFDRVPAMFDRDSVLMQGKSYYALRLMGVADQLHPKLFNAIHKEGVLLNTQQEMEEFLAEQGVDLEAYRKAMKSFAVQTQARRASVLGDRYDLRAVPSIIVDGKYRATGLAGEAMMQLTDHLIEKVKVERGIASQ